MPHVSVIATFYNLAAYVRRCVGSILAQKGLGDFEVILVDDGSTDGTAQLLDAYAGDPRVRVEHLQNGGVAQARNHGVRLARAPWVTFVDGDDFVSPYYLAILVEAQRETGCKLVSAAHVIVKDGEDYENWPCGAQVRVFKPASAVNALLYNHLDESPWAKLGATSLYLENPFTAGRMYEDVAIAGRHYLTAGRVASVSAPIYAYVMRAGSVVHKRRATVQQVEDFLWATDQLLQPLQERYPSFTDALAYRRALELMRVWSVVQTLPASLDRSSYRAQLLSQLRDLWRRVRRDSQAPRGNVARLGLLTHAPALYDTAFAAYETVAKGVRRSAS